MSTELTVDIPVNTNRCDILFLLRGAPGLDTPPPSISVEGAEPGLILVGINVSQIAEIDIRGDSEESQYSFHVILTTPDPTKVLGDYLTAPTVWLSNLPNFWEVTTTVTTSQGEPLGLPNVSVSGNGSPKLVWADISQNVQWARTDNPSQWLDADQTYDFAAAPSNMIAWAVLDNTPMVPPQNVKYLYTSGTRPEWKLYGGPGANAMVSGSQSPVSDSSIAYEYVPPDWNHADLGIGSVVAYIILFADAAATQCIGYLSVELQSYGTTDYVYTLKAWKEGTPPDFDFLVP